MNASSRHEGLALFALAAQSLLALGGGAMLAGKLLPPDSPWVIAGALGLLAAVWAGYGAARGLAPLFLAQVAARYASHGEVPGTRGPTRADRAFDKVAMVVALVAMLAVGGLTGVVLWAVAGQDFLLFTSGFVALSAGLWVITPHGIQALS